MAGHMCSRRHRCPTAGIHHGRVVGELCFGPIFRSQQISPQQCFHLWKESFTHLCESERWFGGCGQPEMGFGRVVCALQASQGSEWLMKIWAVFILQGLPRLHKTSADPKENNAWAALLSAIYLLATLRPFFPGDMKTGVRRD